MEHTWRGQSSAEPMENIWKKLKKLKEPLKALNRNEYKGIEQKISKVREEVKQLQDQLRRNYTDTAAVLEKEQIQELEKWSSIEESILRQKARTKWIQLGDANNKYFSATIKERIQNKQIIEITSLQGSKLTRQQEIKEEIQSFYQGLIGIAAQSLPAVNTKVMKRGPKINQQQGIKLCQPVTDEKNLFRTKVY